MDIPAWIAAVKHLLIPRVITIKGDMQAFFNLKPVYYVRTTIKRLITTIKTMVS